MNAKDLRRLSTSALERLRDAIESELLDRVSREAREQEERDARTVVAVRYVQEHIRCGKPSCHCATGSAGHGPYWYRYETMGSGKVRKRYEGKQKPKGA